MKQWLCASSRYPHERCSRLVGGAPQWGPSMEYHYSRRSLWSAVFHRRRLHTLHLPDQACSSDIVNCSTGTCAHLWISCRQAASARRGSLYSPQYRREDLGLQKVETPIKKMCIVRACVGDPPAGAPPGGAPRTLRASILVLPSVGALTHWRSCRTFSHAPVTRHDLVHACF